jgi:hypothetical protein
VTSARPQAEEKARRATLAKVAELAWTAEWRGRFVYTCAASVEEMSMIEGAAVKQGVLIVAPE